MELYRKIWHDDVRPAPEGWAWARTNDEAKLLLEVLDVEVISLDHDLGATYSYRATVEEILALAGPSPDGTGLDLVRWMIDNERVPALVLIHSWNNVGAIEMRQALLDAGHSNAHLWPFDGSHYEPAALARWGHDVRR